MISDPRFFSVPKPVSLRDLAGALGIQIPEDANGKEVRTITRPSEANDHALSFFYPAKGDDTKPPQHGFCLVMARDVSKLPKEVTPLISSNPRLDFSKAADLFYTTAFPSGIAKTAIVSPSAHIDPSAHIGEFAMVEDNAVIGPNAYVGAYAHIGRGVQTGSNCRIGDYSKVHYTVMGNNVTIGTMCDVGGEGFVYGIDTATRTAKLFPHLGSVIIGDQVAIGDQSQVKRGTLSDTVIAADCKIALHSVIGNDSHIGEASAIYPNALILGSVDIGKNARIYAGSVIRDHLKIGDGATIAMGSTVVKNVATNATVAGTAATEKQLTRI